MVLKRANIFALFCCGLFLLTGVLFIAKPGIQTDEALFGAGIYGPYWDRYARVKVFGHEYSLMVMSYVGTLKARIWSPIFRYLGVTAGTIRIPALLIGAISVWWFYRLLVRTLGVRAAIAGCGILATDSLYLLTIRWDWGPVALQHALLIGGMLGVVGWWQDQRLRLLGLGFFAFGLAMWDKALFAWSLAGLVAATVPIFPREMLASIRRKNVLTATLCFLLGASPLLVYNVRTHWTTFRSNTQRATEDLSYKASLLRDTIDGSSMFGSIARPDWEQPVRTPNRRLEKAVIALSEAAGAPHHSIQLLLLVIGVGLLPLYWHTPSRKAVLFALVFSVVTWAQMASLRNGGTGVHHTILLWPMPALIVAAATAAITDRTDKPLRSLAVVTGLAMLSGLLVTTSYYRDVLRNGGTTAWTEAIYPTAAHLRALDVEEVCVMEWGFFDNLRVLGRGKLRMNVAADPTANDLDRRAALIQISNPRTAFVTHTKGNEIEPGRTGRILKFAEEQGYRQVNLRAFADANGRPMVEVFSFERAQ